MGKYKINILGLCKTKWNGPDIEIVTTDETDHTVKLKRKVLLTVEEWS